MTPNKDEKIIHGKTASAGYAIGDIALCLPRVWQIGRKIDPLTEQQQLGTALATATAQLKCLRLETDQLGAQILEFQLELINDRQLIRPILERIRQGASADAAWQAELDLQVNDYLAAEDENFQARANDFVDLRDRILALLHRADTLPTAVGPNAIYCTDDLTPSRFLETDWSWFTGIALAQGSAASHVAILARARGIPMIIGLGDTIAQIENRTQAILDADAGLLIQKPGASTRQRYERLITTKRLRGQRDEAYLPRPALTASGKRIRIYINVDDPVGLQDMDPTFCDGIGLTRTEWLFLNNTGLPDEELQFKVYTDLLAWAGGKPVTVRTLDAGGDKPIPGLTLNRESNPFLGLRGLRLSLYKPDVFRVQIRALARAAAHGPLKILLPMVTTPEEVEKTRNLLQLEVDNLKQSGFDAKMPPLGIMVEVPAAALRIHAFKADFFSIGSNDLIQYLTAASRECVEVAELQDPLNPAILELIRRVAAYGMATAKEVGLCGDMASVVEFLPALLDTGVSSLSVMPSALARVKAAVAKYGG